MPSDFFLENPVNLSISRSKFSLSHKNTLTFSPGRLVPILAYSDILPGDTFKLDCSFVCRSTTPIAPVMDDADIQIEFYFVPHKLVLSRAYMSPSTSDSNHSFAAFIGAQDSLLNMPLPSDVELPALAYYINSGDSAKASYSKSLMHYLGYPYLPDFYGKLPAGVTGNECFLNPLPALAFYAVWSENYRDPNLFSPVTFSITNDAVVFTVNSDAKIKSVINGNTGLAGTELPPVCRYHGYFGSCLPWPQRNSASVTLPLGESADLYLKPSVYSLKKLDGSNPDFGVKFGATSALLPGGDSGEHAVPLFLDFNGNSTHDGTLTPGNSDSVDDVSTHFVHRTNLAVNLESATAASINTIRTAFAYQRWFEQLARSGNRIQDVTRMFGVIPHDMADDRPVYLGGKRLPLTQTQVENTSGTSYSTSTQQSIGSTGAFSLTSGSDHYFTKSFDTWGTLIGVCCVRCKDSFSNMLPKMLTRRNRFDFYWPQFANLGEQNVDLATFDAASLAAGHGSDVFGYQEYAAEYRYLPDRVTGEVNKDVGGSVGYWTYANAGLYSSGITGLKAFLDASGQVDNFDQTLQVSDSTAGFTFLAQFYFNIIASRPMPMYSIPGLLDHH